MSLKSLTFNMRGGVSPPLFDALTTFLSFFYTTTCHFTTNLKAHFKRFVFISFRIGHQVPVQLSSKYDNEMPEYSNLPQPRTQATLASAAANAATSMSFNR